MDKNLKKVLKNAKLSESTISTVFGALVVVIVGILIFNYFKQSKLNESITDEAAQETQGIEFEEENGEMIPTNLPVDHEVVAGETLWLISEKYYGTGYNWVDIVEKNNLVNPDNISEGQLLAIPKVAVKNPEGVNLTEKVLADTAAIPENNTYVVKKGESLWDISVAVYADGYKWPEIAQTNNLTNPDLIEEGQTLKLP